MQSRNAVLARGKPEGGSGEGGCRRCWPCPRKPVRLPSLYLTIIDVALPCTRLQLHADNPHIRQRLMLLSQVYQERETSFSS